jgi:AraC-like DNA-binding protein
VRLVRLLATPKAIPVLYPAIMREISFWLLTGKNCGEVARVVLPNSRTRRLAEAIQILRDDYVRPIRIDELASVAHMSPSSFHQHFRTLTSMTPLQYQKQLRLLAARRLMTASGINVAAAAYQVGYESASQFSREYARMFGMPPKRDVIEWKLAPQEPVL